MARRSFVNSENPQGAPPPQHKTAAMNALSAMAKRGSNNVNVEQMQRPLPKKALGTEPKQLPPSPVAVEALGRLMPQQGYGAPQQQQPMPAAPQQPVAPPPQRQAPQPVAAPMETDAMDPMAAPDGYWESVLIKTIENDPRAQQGQRDWRHDTLDKLATMRQKLDSIWEYMATGDSSTIKPFVRDLHRKSANV